MTDGSATQPRNVRRILRFTFVPFVVKFFECCRMNWESVSLLPERNLIRRDGRVAEGARLESVYTLTRIVGSNPTLSASQSANPTFLWTRANSPLFGLIPRVA